MAAGENDGIDLGGMSAFGQSGSRRNTAAKIGAKISTEGVRSLVTDMQALLRVLRDVRKEYAEINKLGGTTTPGGVGQGSTSQFGQMVRGFQGQGGGPGGTGIIPAMGGGGPGMGRFGTFVASAAQFAYGNVMGRMNQVMQQSIPISAQDALMASRTGAGYYNLERERLRALGDYAGTRESAQAAQAVAFRFGQSPNQVSNFLESTQRVVQASGGTMTSAQAAASVSPFLDPMVMRRAVGLGITPARVRGQVRNPLTVAQDYIKDYERRFRVRLNAIDFQNMQAVGSRLRVTFQNVYGLTDEALDTIVQAGQQTLQAGGSLDYSNQSDIAALGLNNSRLALQAMNFTSAVAGRDMRFFQNQEGSMVSRLGSEITIQETLADVEDAFGGILGKLYEFERVIQAVSIALGVMGGVGGMGGLLRGGGGMGLPGMFGRGAGRAAAGRGAAGAAGAAGTRAAGGGFLAGGAGLGGAAGVAGLALGAYGVHTAMNADSLGDIGVSALTTAGGAALLAPAGLAAPAAAIAAPVIALIAAKSYFDSQNAKGVQTGRDRAVTMSEKQLLDSIQGYVKNSHGWSGPGDKETGAFDVWQLRRSALVAAFLESSFQDPKLASVWDKIPGDKAKGYATMRDMWKKGIKNDWIFREAMRPTIELTEMIRKNPRGEEIYREYFGSASDPFAYVPIETEQAKSLQLSGTDIVRSSSADPNQKSGDAVFDPYRDPPRDRSGDGNPWTTAGGAADSAKGATWDRLDPRMKQRLTQMFAASGGRVWLGVGWRSEEEQKRMFLDRHRPDPNGSISWNGQRWTRVKGAAAAPPGRSMHEIGLAADLVGDLGWVQANAAKFGLKHFANVNNEPWHVQLQELPNSRSEFEKGGGTGDTSGGMGAAAPMMVETGGGGGTPAVSGVGYSLVDSMKTGRQPAGSGVAQAVALAAGAGGMPGGVAPGSVSINGFTPEKAALLAYQQGWRGQDLIDAVAIMGRESNYNPMAHNPNRATGDDSYGLFQINMLGNLGPARRAALGLQSNEQLFDPATNMRAAWMLYQQGGNTFHHWGGYKGMSNTYSTDRNRALQIIQAAGINVSGDGPFDKGMSDYMPAAPNTAPAQAANLAIRSSGGAAINVNVTLRADGVPSDQAAQIAQAMKPALESVMMEMAIKRDS